MCIGTIDIYKVTILSRANGSNWCRHFVGKVPSRLDIQDALDQETADKALPGQANVEVFVDLASRLPENFADIARQAAGGYIIYAAQVEIGNINLDKGWAYKV